MVDLHRFTHGRRFVAVITAAGIAASLALLWVSIKGLADSGDISFQSGDNIGEATEPFTVRAEWIVARFVDADNALRQTPGASPSPTSGTPLCDNTDAYSATIDWGDGSAIDTGTVDCDTSGQSQYAVFSDNRHTYADAGTWHVTVTVDDRPTSQSPADKDASQTMTAVIGDASISTRSATNVTGTEGQNVTVSATFNDNVESSTFFDSHLTARVDWGDTTSSAGTVSAPTNRNECECNVLVTATHTYDARATKYTATVTLNDDAGSTSHETLTATIADAALTAGSPKSFTGSAAQPTTQVVASFNDAAAAQAAAADFSATIKWGDNTTSSGTVTKTGSGAFNVSGTHTYATSGTKSLTITVTDEEGQTLTMSATATVPVLPATGQPRGSGNSGWPLLPLTLILTGLIAVSVGIIRRRLAAR